MYKKIMIVSLSALLIGCSAKSSTVQSSAITGGTVGVLAGAVMGSTVAFASGETGNKLATKAVIFGILVGLAGAGIGSSVEYTKEIFGGDKEEKEANKKIYHAIEKANKREEKTKIYDKEKIENEIKKLEKNEIHNTIEIPVVDTEEKETNQKINHAIEKSNKPQEKIKIYHKDEIVDVTDILDNTVNIEQNETNNSIKVYHDEVEDTTNKVYTIEDEPISVSTDINTTILKEAYSKEIE